jgi:parvulin-like peptidyl-prolyl isomerase
MNSKKHGTCMQHTRKKPFRKKLHGKIPPQKRAREILVTIDEWNTSTTKEGWLIRRSVRNRAREIRERIIEGEDFSEMAQRVSAAPTAASGGDMGWIQMPSTYLIDTTLAALEPGEVSPPMATPKGYWLVKLEEVKPRRTMTYEEARARLETIWRARAHKAIIDNLKREWKHGVGKKTSPKGSVRK